MLNINDPLLKYKIGMVLIPGIGSILAKKLIEYTGGPEEVFRSSKTLLERIPGIGKTLAGKIAGQQIPDKAQKEIEFISRYKIKSYYYLDDDYPERLRDCPDAPVILFAKGSADVNHPRILSIVGTRNATGYGLEFCRNLISELADRGYDPLIMSGLAYGIDICAHKTALDKNLPTIAALAHGLSTIYPPEHRHYAEKITARGALVTDFPGHILPERGNFIKRNRLIAGMADATIVIESATKGGALLTAELANSYNREVFALPGRINDKRSQGCNDLIKTHRAALISCTKDIEYILGWTPVENPENIRHPVSCPEAGEEGQTILDLLAENSELTADHISLATGFGASKTSCLLLDLEFKGYICSLPGKIYRLSQSATMQLPRPHPG
jgi:DNA processing protein